MLPHSEGLELPSIGEEGLDVLWTRHALRSLSLTWNHENAYGFSCYDDEAAPLKPAGRRQAVPATRGERQPRRCDCGFDLGKPADGELTDRGPVRRIDAGRSQRRLVPDTTN